MLRRPLPWLLVCLTSLLACCAPIDAQQKKDTPGTSARAPGPAEFRAAWIATVDNIDFPSRPGLPVASMQAELDAIVARAVALRLNALVFQVRPAADAFYRSSLEPWSEWLTGEQGKAPTGDFDPLAYVIDRCHQNGLSLHAWFNPFRCWHPAGKSKPHASHVTQRAPELCVEYGRFGWMDPGQPVASKWSLAVIQDVVRRYDVDGVHIDDYFYPYPEGKRAFPDDASYAKYERDGGKLGRDDWRRHNIDDFVERMYRLVHDDKPWVMVGISPFGIARPGVPRGIKAGLDQYGQLYADVPKWLQNGWLDYLAPQLYWPIDQQAQGFAELLAYWHSQNPKGRAIWPGLYTTKILAGKPPLRATELRDEIELVRQASAAGMSGQIHFSFKALQKDAANVSASLQKDVYTSPVPVPRLPWLGERPR